MTGRRRRALAGLVLVAAFPAPALGAEDPLDVSVRRDLAFATTQLARTVSGYPVSAYPFYTGADGRWITTSRTQWTSGFLPGALWLAYQATGDPAWRTRAQNSQAGVRPQAAVTTTMDIGFQILDSFGNGHRLTETADFKSVTLQAAASLASRFNDKVGMIRSWNNPAGAPATDFRVIVDGLMNLEILFWAANNGGSPAYRTMAMRHALRTAQDHVRPDGTVYQLIIYDSSTGGVKVKTTSPGYSAESTWARGQAWAVRGFALSYRESGDATLLAAARRTADAYLKKLAATSSDSVPPWDFDAPPPRPKDSSAAAIAASGLIELARLEPDAARAERYLAAGRRMLTALSSSAYLAQGTNNAAILLHATYHYKQGIYDTGSIWGDYFFLEALMNLRRIPPATAPLPIARLASSVYSGTDGPARAVDGNLATAWSANGTSTWLRLDLGSVRAISKVTLAYAMGDQRASRFSIQTSNDASTWATRANALTSGATLQPETYDIPDVSARYVRIVGRGSSVDTWNRISEVTVR